MENSSVQDNTTINQEIRQDLELIMRQTECYNMEVLLEKYKMNKCDVLETIFDILDLKPSLPGNATPTELETFRKIMEEKDNMFFQMTNKAPTPTPQKTNKKEKHLKGVK